MKRYRKPELPKYTPKMWNKHNYMDFRDAWYAYTGKVWEGEKPR